MSQTKAQLIDTLVASLLPASDSSVDIGSNAVRFANIYGDTLYGNGANLTGINTDLVSDTSPQLGGTLDTNGNLITFGDSSGATDDRLKFGVGADLSIYHNATDSYIENKTNDLYILTSGSGDDIIIKSNDDIFIQPQNGEDGIKVIGNGAVELYYDNSKKFETLSNGVKVNGNALLLDGYQLRLGDDNDTQIFHNGSNFFLENTTGNLILKDTSGSIYLQSSNIFIQDDTTNENIAKFISDGAVELYHDNAKVFSTESNGIQVLAKEGFSAFLRLYADEGDDNADQYWLKTEQDGTGFHIQNNVSGSTETNLRALGNGTTELFYDNSKKLETTSGGVDITGTMMADGIQIQDTHKINLGNSQDLQIYHDGSHSYIQDVGTGKLRLTTNSFRLLETDNSTAMIAADQDGAVYLYHNGSLRCETESNGASVTGRLRVQDSGDVDFVISDTSSNAVSGFLQVKTAGRLEYNVYKSGVGTKYPHVFVGYTEEYARIDTNGIKFNGDTAAANALDDYEEGTWSPSGSWTTITASYTKIGRMVYAGFSLRANATSGNVTIGNLPFTSGSTHGHVGGITWGLCEFNTTDSWLNGSVDDDSTTATVRRGNATIVTYGSGNNNMNQNAFIRGMIIYMTD